MYDKNYVILYLIYDYNHLYMDLDEMYMFYIYNLNHYL